MKPLLTVAAILLSLAPTLTAADRPDILVADFEGDDYGDWKTTGEAFGTGPAQGALPGQMPVSGFKGKGLVNSFHGGDKSIGTLTSPAFKIERKYLNFLVGGGKYPGETCINLLLDGKVVRTATGPNDRPGGSEQLDWHTWDVTDLDGKNVVIQIVDQRTEGWGHINVDHIVQGDRKLMAEPAWREIAVASRYLHLPVQTGAAKLRMKLVADGKTVREFDIELADDKADFWAFCDVGDFKGKKLTVEVNRLSSESKTLAAITQGDDIKGEPLYQEKQRPQFHFTSRRGWLNDPNGLVYHQGEYHLFYQHNPYGWNWDNMHWGHAISKDLVHWLELGEAIYPKQYGDWAFSGSAIVDTPNTTDLSKSDEKALIAAFTSTGRGECLVVSTDRGRTWTELPCNPVVKHVGRDPRLLWHAPTRRWVMAVYDERDGKRWIVFHTSVNLKDWKEGGHIEGYFECPDLFEIAVDGDAQKKKWVLYAADGKYATGDFDGAKFTPDGPKQQLWHGNFYAAQTFSNAPDGRRIQIGWGQGITFPGMPFNQQMTVPVELTLRSTPDGVRLFALPVKELDALHGKKHTIDAQMLKPGENPLGGITGELFDIRAEFEVKDAERFGLVVRGVSVEYDVKKRQLRCKDKVVPLAPDQGKIRLRILADRGSIEVFVNDGQAAVSVGVILADKNRSLEAFSQGGATGVKALEVFEMKSGWEK